MRRTPLRAAFGALGLGLILTLSGCGLGRDSGGDSGISDPIVAATVNGRPIYTEDVRSHAVALGLLQEGQDLDANSDAFYFALEELIQARLFAMEAEARGLDRQPAVRRQLELARERVLANAIYDELNTRATDPEVIERLYRENASRLGQGQEIHLRHMQFDSREVADAAKRRLDQGERFEALAFELSTDRATAPDGGDLGFRAVSDLAPPIREASERANVGETVGPVQYNSTWHIIRVEDRRERGVPSLETLRPRIIDWLRFQEIQQLHERLAADASVVRMREPEVAADPGGEATAPADAEDEAITPTVPQTGTLPGQPAPPFPFPMGPGGVTGGGAQPAPAPETPPAQAPADNVGGGPTQ